MHELVPGMVLESPVRDQKGRFLIPAGETVTEKHIRVCKIWGATDIWVKTSDSRDHSPAESVNEIPEPIRFQAEQRVREWFGDNDLENEFLAQVFRIAVQRKAMEMHSHGKSKEPSAAKDNRTWAESRYQPRKPSRSITLQSLINERMKLPALPDIYHKTMASVYNVDVPIAEIAQVISKDPSLSAKVLQLVNSSFYGLLKPVETLTHALALIGTDQLMIIVTGVSVVSVFKDLSSSMLNMRQFWEHSVACGIVCRQLASYMNGVVNSERYFVAGLLHDIGRLAMIQGVAEDMARSMAKSRVHKLPLVRAEAQVLGFDHAQAGAYLAQTWSLPTPLERMIRYHHAPESAAQNIDPAVVAVSDFVVTALEIGCSGNRYLPAFYPETWKRLDLSPSILENVVFQLDNQLNDTFVLIYGN
ncbi:MAG: HDOD domain-containing protein [Desulfovermiculus sp.]